MVTDVNQTYCDHFAVYTNIKPLCFIPENNIKYVNYTSEKKAQSYTLIIKINFG